MLKIKNANKILTQIVTVFMFCYFSAVFLGFLFKVKVLIVTSNSMAPSFSFGDVLLAVSQEHYSPEESISFQKDDQSLIATHRIVAVHKTNTGVLYQTKGDANSSADSQLVASQEVIGKTVLILPKIGYLFLFLQSKLFLKFLITLLSFYFVKNTVKKIKRKMYESK